MEILLKMSASVDIYRACKLKWTNGNILHCNITPLYENEQKFEKNITASSRRKKLSILFIRQYCFVLRLRNPTNLHSSIAVSQLLFKLPHPRKFWCPLFPVDMLLQNSRYIWEGYLHFLWFEHKFLVYSHHFLTKGVLIIKSREWEDHLSICRD